MLRATPYRFKPPKSVPITWGPCLGMKDSLAPSAADKDHAKLLGNLYVRDTEFGPVVVGRPGLSLLGSQLGASDARLGQRMVQFSKKDGTEYTVAIVGGKVYTYDWSADSFTTVLTQAQIQSGGAALSSLQKVYCVTFADKLVISDGVNAPFTWDGTTGGGVALLSITNNVNKAAYGQPWVYYNKLFLILAGARTTIVWSEENDPTIGYEVGGYNNAWDMIQTSVEQIVAGVGLNEQMVVLRAFSITSVTGAVTTDFQSTGTREGISESIGIVGPDAVTVYDDTVYFGGSDRRLYAFRPGTGLREVGEGARATLQQVSRAFLGTMIACKWTFGKQVWFLFNGPNQSAAGTVVAINAARGDVGGLFTGWFGTTLDEVLDFDDVPTLVHLGGSGNTTDADGYAYRHGNPDQNFWEDTFQTGAVAITHTLETGAFAFDPRVDKQFIRLDVDFPAPATLTEFDVSYTTPRTASSTSLTVTCARASASLWDDVQWDDFTWASGNGIPHASAGLNGSGRWLDLTVTHDTIHEQVGISELVITAVPLSVDPTVY